MPTKPPPMVITATSVSTPSSNSINHESIAKKEGAKRKLEELSKTIDALLDRGGPRYELAAEVGRTLMQAFELLFEFQQEGQVDAAKLCGVELVHVLADFMDSPEVVEQAVLCLSTMSSHEEARMTLVESTDILPVCIQALANSGHDALLRERMLGLVGVFLKGFVKEAVQAGLKTPLLDILNTSESVSDIRGAVGLVLGLLEPGDLGISAEFMFDGGVSLLLRNAARVCPEGASAEEQMSYRYLHSLSLRGIACILRHQPLARDLSPQLFETDSGRFQLQAVVEHCTALTDVSRWLFAAEILVWLASVPHCRPLLLQFKAKAALRKVISQADPYAKWPTLSNQVVTGKSLMVLFGCVEERHLLAQEQQGFLALWMNRYSAGKASATAEDTTQVRTILGLRWTSFGTMMLASGDEATRHHAHAAMQGLSGESNRRIPDLTKVKVDPSIAATAVLSSRNDIAHAEATAAAAAAAATAERDHRESIAMMEHILGTVGLDNALPPAPVPIPVQDPKVETIVEISRRADESTLLLEYLICPLGLNTNEERVTVRKLLEVHLTLPVLLRPGVPLASIAKSIEELDQMTIGTKLAVVDGVRDLRDVQTTSRKKVLRMSDVAKKSIHRLDVSKSGARRRNSRKPPTMATKHQSPFVRKLSGGSTGGGEEQIPIAQCFISYFPTQSREAQALAKRLERMAISCYVDDEKDQLHTDHDHHDDHVQTHHSSNTGGASVTGGTGTMNFDKVNSILSSCEVVLCLVTPEYVRSVDCNRELLLATARKKTIIPIVLQSLDRWPPRGIAAPLLTGKVCVSLDDRSPKAAEKRFMALGMALQLVLGMAQRPMGLAMTPTPSVSGSRRPSSDFVEEFEEDVDDDDDDDDDDEDDDEGCVVRDVDDYSSNEFRGE